VSEEKTTDLDFMYKTQKIKTPILEEGYSIDSHNAKSVELSELPSATSTEEQSKVTTVADIFRERNQVYKKQMHKTLSFAD
jgi:hypothetical protein